MPSKLPFTPQYLMENPNDEIQLLCDEAMGISKGDEITYLKKGSPFFSFLPSPRVFVDVDFDEWLSLEIRDNIQIIFYRNGIQFEAKLKSINRNSGRTNKTFCKLIPKLFFFKTVKNNPHASEAIFHLSNFTQNSGHPLIYETNEKMEFSCHRIELSDNVWEIVLFEYKGLEEKRKALKNTGGYILTHFGKITKKDHSSFLYEEDLDPLYKSLYRFFSFARGFNVAPIFTVAFDQNGQELYEEWGSRYINSYREVLSWHDGHHANSLEQLFPGFMDKWNDPLWKDTIDEAIYWYVGANDAKRGLEVGIILCQAALELLAWTYEVQDKRLISENGFNKLNASDRIRRLFSSLKIPINIHPDLIKLNTLARKNSWDDSPRVFTEIRNGIIHPKSKPGTEGGDVHNEAWKLGTWLVEMVLLRLFCYNGKYFNRLRKQLRDGEKEKVPWA